MKNLIFILTAIAVVSFTGLKTQAQQNALLAQNTSTPGNIDDRVMKKFQNTYPDVDDVLWQHTPNGYTASFKTGDVTTIWVYNNRHNIGYEVKRYDKSQLPDHIQERIANAYNEYDIEAAEEIRVMDQVYYFVWITSNKYRKFLKIDDNEIYACESMNKENL